MFKRDPRTPIAVTNERTYRRAVWAASVLLDTDHLTPGDQARAAAHLRQIAGWLRRTISRPPWGVSAAERAERLKQVEQLLTALTTTGTEPA